MRTAWGQVKNNLTVDGAGKPVPLLILKEKSSAGDSRGYCEKTGWHLYRHGCGVGWMYLAFVQGERKRRDRQGGKSVRIGIHMLCMCM